MIGSAGLPYRFLLALLALCSIGPRPIARAQSLFDAELRLAVEFRPERLAPVLTYEHSIAFAWWTSLRRP